MLGSWSTAKVTKMPDEVRKNLPYSLLTQAGVAIGLAALAYSRLFEIGTVDAKNVAVLLLEIITISVLISEIVGPLLVKFAITRAGEFTFRGRHRMNPIQSLGFYWANLEILIKKTSGSSWISIIGLP